MTPQSDAPSTPATRWLDGEEMAAWLPLMRVLLQLPYALDRQLRDSAGLNHAHYGILAALSAQPDHALPMTDVARISAISLSRLSHAITSMQERGWVTREPCPGNRRVQNVSLTAAGMRLLDAVAPGHVAEVRRVVFDQLTATDVSDLRRIATKILAGLDR